MSLDKTMTNRTTAGIVLVSLVVLVLGIVTTRSVRGTYLTPPSTSGLAETSWQLVKFQGPGGTTLTPDDRAKYTIEFAAGGRMVARVDCNRGRGTWESSGENHIKFGPLALTRAMCPAGSLHDHIANHWTDIRTYAVKDGHLFLSLVADGGSYEFEPATKSK